MGIFKTVTRERHVPKRLIGVAIAVVSAVIGSSLTLSRASARFNDAFYDLAYRLRKPAAQDVVIVTADQASLDAMAAGTNHWGWPWPRQLWGMAIEYAQKCGAKVAAVDMFFSEPSVHNDELGDDARFAEILDGLKMPVIFPVLLGDGQITHFAPPVKKPPITASVNIMTGSTVRDYLASIDGIPTMAIQAVRQAGHSLPPWAGDTFRLRYYGKHRYPDGRTTFRYISANNLINAAIDPDHPHEHGIDPAVFADKIVLFGTTAPGTYDLKSSPLDEIYPGVEVHATAIADLLDWQRVMVLGPGMILAITLLTATLTTLATMTARKTTVKLLFSMSILCGLFIVVAILFRRNNIIWLPPVSPLAGGLISIVLALSWSYFAEDRQARFFVKALGQYVSPTVAAELKADPTKLAISTEKRELTILFSDIVSFTDLSERLGEKVGPLLNFYLDEMSQPVWAQDGTVDKYIGDAIMSFWNAPLLQPDHAACACSAALAMKRRLEEIQPQLAALEAPGMMARIGISSGVCTFGNMGAKSKFNYSVIGDACNFASRLEGANKLYGTRILLGEATAKLVRDKFITRQVDLLRVKGKLHPVAVYELLGAGTPDAETAKLIGDYETAFHRYSQGNWKAAEEILLDLLQRKPDDGPSHTLLGRVVAFSENPPPSPWDGVFIAKEK